jgi:hypothetical protein
MREIDKLLESWRQIKYKLSLDFMVKQVQPKCLNLRDYILIVTIYASN